MVDSTQPRDAHLMALLIKSMDIHQHDPKVVPQLLDFAHRYISGIVQDAGVFSNHANKPEIDIEDVKLAIEGKITHSFSYPPSKDFMAEIADKRNEIPLPIVPDKFGVRIPPERNCLTGINFDIVPSRIVVEKEDEVMEDDEYDIGEKVEALKAQAAIDEASTAAFNMPDLMRTQPLYTQAIEIKSLKPVSNQVDEEDDYDME